MRQRTVLIAISHVPLRSSLAALVRSLPSVGRVESPADAGEVLRLISALPLHLVILAANPNEPWFISPGEVRQRSPGTPIVLLTNGTGSDPVEHEVDLVIQQGAPPSVLVAEVERLLLPG